MALRWRKPHLFYQNVQWNFNMWHHWTVGGLPIEHAFMMAIPASSRIASTRCGVSGPDWIQLHTGLDPAARQ